MDESSKPRFEKGQPHEQGRARRKRHTGGTPAGAAHEQAATIPDRHELPQGASRLLYHIVFGTRGQENVINAHIRERLFPYIAAILRNQGAETVLVNGMSDHVHILCQLSPTSVVAEVIERIKVASTSWVQKTFNYPGFEWQTSYLVFSVSPSQLPKVQDYITHQKEHHEKTSFLQESRELLERHDVRYDEQALVA